MLNLHVVQNGAQFRVRDIRKSIFVSGLGVSRHDESLFEVFVVGAVSCKKHQKLVFWPILLFYIALQCRKNLVLSWIWNNQRIEAVVVT